MMFRKTLAPIATAVVLISLAACSTPAPANDTGKTPDSEPVASTPTPEATAPATDTEFGETKLSPRGNLVKEIGQLAGTGLPEDAQTLGSRFVVTDIVLDPTCDSGFADPPVNGHFVAVHLNVETTPELAESDYPEVWISEYDWQAFDSDGKRLNDPVGNAWTCMSDAASLPASIGPGQSVSGYVVLDVAATTGTLVLTMDGAATGWEWDY